VAGYAAHAPFQRHPFDRSIPKLREKHMISRHMTVWLVCIAIVFAAVRASADAEEDFYRGVQKYRGGDYVEAAAWFRKSAEQGDPDAQFLLGRMNYDGNSLPQDYVEAFKWFEIAAVGGVAVAEQYRDGLAKAMTPEQIARARKLAGEWLERYQKKD
jgi:TPR repeat protein